MLVRHLGCVNPNASMNSAPRWMPSPRPETVDRLGARRLRHCRCLSLTRDCRKLASPAAADVSATAGRVPPGLGLGVPEKLTGAAQACQANSKPQIFSAFGAIAIKWFDAVARRMPLRRGGLRGRGRVARSGGVQLLDLRQKGLPALDRAAAEFSFAKGRGAAYRVPLQHRHGAA